MPQLPSGGKNPVLEGNATLDINLMVGDDRTRTKITTRNNYLPITLNTGRAREARGYSL
jgi:hypothetical protein